MFLSVLARMVACTGDVMAVLFKIQRLRSGQAKMTIPSFIMDHIFFDADRGGMELDKDDKGMFVKLRPVRRVE